MTQCFSAPPSAAIVDRNCSIPLTVRQTGFSFYTRGTYYPVTMFSRPNAGKGSPDAQYCELMWCPATLTALR